MATKRFKRPRDRIARAKLAVVDKPTRTKIGRMSSASLMSDTKWRKMFAALDRPDLELGQAIVKFISSKREHRISTPRRSSLHPPWAFIDTSEFGPFALRCIEWIEFPSVAEYEYPTTRTHSGRVPPKLVTQDIAKIRAILTSLGHFPIEQTERGLRIIGHVRSANSN